MKILILDNYDSFTYNIVHALKKLGFEDVDVIRNDKINIEDVNIYDKIILSPGPGIPSEAGILLPLIKKYGTEKPILGICLGHQAIGEAFGASLTNLDEVYHGISSTVSILDKEGVFKNMADEITVGRYHSWVINPETLPEDLKITAKTEDSQIMGIAHKN